ncbi:MAG TPA: Hpt domain-containing protein [Thermoanaerobaculia bacterium]|nr:Hpt domain-containing protein [Thermoanaerobaculia bacterium]
MPNDPELDELRREFLAEATDKVREIQAALDAGSSGEALDRLAYLSHQLKGAGGSYGYERISSEAAEIEKAAETIAAGNGANINGSLQQHVINLRAEIEKRLRELTRMVSRV